MMKFSCLFVFLCVADTLRVTPADNTEKLKLEAITDTQANWLPKGAGPHDVAFTAVLSKLKDANGREWKNSKNDIAQWASGVKHFGMHGVVIHDGGFSPEDIKELSSEQLSFINPLESSIWKNTVWEKDWQGLTINDQRFYAAGAIMEAYKDQLGYVLMTDSRDVDFGRDPFKLMRATDSAMNSSFVFVQDEWRPHYDMGLPDRHETAWLWVADRYSKCFGKEMPQEWTYGALYNNGAIGGSVTKVISLLQSIRQKSQEIVPEKRAILSCGMPTINKVVQEDFKDHIVTGYPFNGKFKHPDNEEVAAVLHKSTWSPRGESANHERTGLKVQD